MVEILHTIMKVLLKLNQMVQVMTKKENICTPEKVVVHGIKGKRKIKRNAKKKLYENKRNMSEWIVVLATIIMIMIYLIIILFKCVIMIMMHMINIFQALLKKHISKLFKW